ncbi:MAG: cell division protein ZapB [Gammaproteobacteria bacterium]|nr:cell division protein ZapB [Rhodocyclaceae bacterium]MBU3909311.1 cell division protein ZapB [Gammaproteobacteria bacterium]MBU3989698.1 cell division protein ZapB [Gammaproteobacteria bacterium]MBU4005529.1 cell division protein ZapB [Gammaproteobacteria bacterium]MBU4020918.1 cell division protein ZapB [Gammaproteobacteria bacterium]
MNDEFGGLENKVNQVIALCDALRAENHRLRDLVSTIENEKTELTERMATARTRLEDLMDRLPE